MELKDLGLQKLKLNINDNIIETVFAKEGDHKSRGLDVQVLKNNVVTDTTGVEVEFYAKPKDGEVYLVLAKEKDLKRGKYEIIYPTHILQPGPVKVEIKLVKGEQVISTKKFILEVENAISTDDIVEKSDERPLLAILVEAAKNEKSRIEAENKRVVAEGKRAETENQREKNESQRKSAESQRQKNEEERKSSEVQRQSNESTRQSQENKRNEAENTRKSSEESRKAVENTRQSNESKRVAAENERVKNEDARKANEVIRIANEKKREENRKIVESWIVNPSQFNGKDLEFIWNDTKLGVRLKGDTEYQYVDLKGQKGDPGSGDMLKSVYDKNNNGIVDKAEESENSNAFNGYPLHGKSAFMVGYSSRADSGHLKPKDRVWTVEEFIDIPSGFYMCDKAAPLTELGLNNNTSLYNLIKFPTNAKERLSALVITRGMRMYVFNKHGGYPSDEMSPNNWIEVSSKDYVDNHKSDESVHVTIAEKEQIETNKYSIINNKSEIDILKLVSLAHEDGPYHIVESGENANGYYVKFADGTLVCYNLLNLVYQSENYLSLSGNKSWIYPAKFKNILCVIPGKSAWWSTDAVIRANISARAEEEGAIVRLYSAPTKPFHKSDTVKTYILAIGRWK